MFLLDFKKFRVSLCAHQFSSQRRTRKSSPLKSINPDLPISHTPMPGKQRVIHQNLGSKKGNAIHTHTRSYIHQSFIRANIRERKKCQKARATGALGDRLFLFLSFSENCVHRGAREPQILHRGFAHACTRTRRDNSSTITSAERSEREILSLYSSAQRKKGREKNSCALHRASISG